MTAVIAPALGSAPAPAPASDRCECGRWFHEECGHGDSQMVWAPGDKWTCPACCKRRMRDELVPEIMLNMGQARSYGWTLKLITPTWRDSNLAAQPTVEGADRRRKDWTHLMQTIKRQEPKFAEDVSVEHPQGRPVPYMKVAETHRSGAVHFHALAVVPFLKQVELSKNWRKHSRDSFRIDIRAVGVRCPVIFSSGRKCWPGRQPRPGESQHAFQGRKRRSMIIPYPGTGKCGNCNYRLEVSDEEVARAVANETVKYITKQFGDGWDLGGEKPNLITKSTTWLRVPKAEEGESGPCEYCDDYHTTTYVGCAGQVEKEFPGIVDSREGRVSYYPPGGAPCLCFGEDVEWRRSTKIAEFILADLVGRGPPVS